MITLCNVYPQHAFNHSSDPIPISPDSKNYTCTGMGAGASVKWAIILANISYFYLNFLAFSLFFPLFVTPPNTFFHDCGIETNNLSCAC